MRYKYVPAVCRLCGSQPVADAQWVKCTNPLCDLSTHKTHVVSWPRRRAVDWPATIDHGVTDLYLALDRRWRALDRLYVRNLPRMMYWAREALGGLLFVLCVAAWIGVLILVGGCSMPAEVAESEKGNMLVCTDLRDGKVWRAPLTDAVAHVGIGVEASVVVTDTDGVTRVIKDSYSSWLKCEKIKNDAG